MKSSWLATLTLSKEEIVACGELSPWHIMILLCLRLLKFLRDSFGDEIGEVFVPTLVLI